MDQYAILRARSFADGAHSGRGQLRKYTDRPYFEHCIEVVDNISKYPHDQSMIIAGYLHDVVEDTDVTIEKIAEDFGDDVAMLVDQMTNKTTRADGNRATRKALDRQRWKQCSVRAQTIKVCDMLSNVSTIVERDREFAKVYVDECRELFKVLVNADSTALSDLDKLLTKSEKQLYG